MGIAEDRAGNLAACSCPAGTHVRTHSTVSVEVDSNAEAVAMAATIWCIQNAGRAEADLDPLPAGVSFADIDEALIRSRKQATRRAIEAHKTTLNTPLPKAAPHDACVDPDQQGDGEVYTGRVPFWLGFACLLLSGLLVWGVFAAIEWARGWFQ